MTWEKMERSHTQREAFLGDTMTVTLNKNSTNSTTFILLKAWESWVWISESLQQQFLHKSTLSTDERGEIWTSESIYVGLQDFKTLPEQVFFPFS